MSQSTVRWLVYPDSWDFADDIKPSAENPKKYGTANAYAIAKWNDEPDTWEHNYEMLNKPPVIDKISISNTNIWYNDKNNIQINCYISDEDKDDGIKYEVLINSTKAVSLDNFISTPTELNIEVPISMFTEKENLLELIIKDKIGLETSFKYNIIKENRDTFIFKRVFDFKEDYIEDSNIEAIYGKGLVLKDIGVGNFELNIPTEGKSKIKNIIINSIEDAQEELTINNPMTYVKDLGAGKVYESRLLTEYSDITNIYILYKRIEVV